MSSRLEDSPSRRVEQSLDEIVKLAGAELSELDRVKRSAKSTELHRQNYAEAKQMYTPELYQPVQPIRSASAPRGMMRNVVFEAALGGQYEQKEQKEEVSVERRFDAFLRKQKLMDDRLKKLEHQKVIDATNAQVLQEEREKLLEDQRADHKAILNLRSQVSSLKAKLESVVAGEDERSRPTTNVVIDGTGSQNINDMVFAAVQSEMQRAVRDITARIQKDQQQVPTISMNHSQLNDSKMSSRGASGVDQMSSMEREMIRLSSEFERVKTRQSTLEAACNELKSTATIREMKAEEAHKRAINAHRVEVESFLGSAARRTADSLATVQSHTSDLLALRSDLDGFTDRAGNALAELDMRISYHDQNKEELYGVLERVDGDIMQLKNQTADAESTLLRFVEDSLKLAKVAGTVDSLSRQLSVCHERIETLDVQLQATSSAVDSHAVPIDMLAKSIDGINEKFEARTDALRESIDTNKQTTDESLSSTADAVKKNKVKVKELTESLKGVSQIRQSIEAVLREVDNRAKQDASWTYSFKTGLQKVEGRLQAVENALISSSGHTEEQALISASEDGSLRSSQPDGPSGSHGGNIANTVGSTFGTGYLQQYTSGGTRQLPLLGTQFDEIRMLIADLRLEVRQTAQEECKTLKDQYAYLLNEQITILEDRFTAVVEERSAQVERYSDEMMSEKLLELHDTIAVVKERQQQDAIALENRTQSMEDTIALIKKECTAIGTALHTLENARLQEDNVSTSAVASISADFKSLEDNLTDQLSAVKAQLVERVDANESSVAAVSEAIQREFAALTERITQQELNTLESGSQLNTHITLIDELHTSLGQCQTILEGHEGRMNDFTDQIEQLREQSDELSENVISQLDNAVKTFSEQCGVLQDDLNTCKEDLSDHVRFTNESLGDLQISIEENAAEVTGSLSEQAKQLTALQSRLSEGLASTSQMSEETRSLLSDLDVKVTQGHTLLERSITEIEQAVANCENGGRSRISGTEKRLAMQEAAMKERVAGLEVKLNSMEDTLRNKVVTMEGSIASQEEQLRDSIPVELRRAQDAELERKMNDIIDVLQAQLNALKERVSEVEGRISSQEGETLNIRSGIESRVSQHMQEVAKSLQQVQDIHAESQQRQADDMLQAVEDRISGIRDLVFQIHELINAQKDEFVEGNQGIMDQLATVEESIASTDNLLSEHVNHMQSELAFLKEELSQKIATSTFHAELAKYENEVSGQLADAASVAGGVAATFSAFEDDCTRRLSELELSSINTQNAAKLRAADVEGHLRALERVAEQQKEELSLAQIALQDKLLGALAQLAERMDSVVESLKDTVRVSETTTHARVSDTNQLMQMQEKRLRTVEKSLDNQATEISTTIRLEMAGKLSSLADSIHASVLGNKESTNALTVQMLALQAQINDHADEVRASIDAEISALKTMVSSDMADFSAANTSAARIEDWLTDLQRAHEDHTEHFQSTMQQIEQRLQSVEETATSLKSEVSRSSHLVEPSVFDERNSVLAKELSSLDSAVKQRLTVLEQKSRSLESTTKHASALGSRLGEIETRVSEAETASLYLTELKANLADIQEQIVACNRSAEDKYREVRAFVDENLSELRRSISSKPSMSTSTVRPTPPEQLPSAHSRPKAHVKPESKGVVNSQELSPKERQEMHHVSQTSVSPVRRQFDSTNCDILDQRCELVPFDRDVDTEPEESDAEEDVLEKAMKSHTPSTGRRPVINASFETNQVVIENENEGDESNIRSRIDSVKFDITALNSHLSARTPVTNSSPPKQDEGDRLEEERQAAVESLQLKKINHRRKFQKALYQHK